MANPKIEQFKKILQLDPKDETLWFGLGKAYMSDENWAEAVPALEQCIQGKTQLFRSLLCPGTITSKT